MTPLEQAHDATRFGGKSAGLARALAHGLPVPRGVALEHGLVAAAIDAPARLAALAASIRSALDGPLAIRSSAIGEDGPDASFAGQHATRLNATSVAAVTRAIVEVWASARTESARAYRARLGLPAEGCMAIVAQELVDADLSGVIFTRNPATGADERVIEVARGLGEAVVQGLVTPEQVRLSREGAVLEHRVGAQDVIVACAAAGGTEERETVPADSALLDARAIGRLGELVADAERCFDGPLDLEFAFSADALFLLQARRVTR